MSKKGNKDPFTSNVSISNPDVKGWPIICRAIIDTGATRTSIDEGLAQALNLAHVGWIKVRSANGLKRRELVDVEVEIFDEKMILEVSVADRTKLSCPILIGRDILHNAYSEEE